MATEGNKEAQERQQLAQKVHAFGDLQEAHLAAHLYATAKQSGSEEACLLRLSRGPLVPCSQGMVPPRFWTNGDSEVNLGALDMSPCVM